MSCTNISNIPSSCVYRRLPERSIMAVLMNSYGTHKLRGKLRLWIRSRHELFIGVSGAGLWLEYRFIRYIRLFVLYFGANCLWLGLSVAPSDLCVECFCCVWKTEWFRGVIVCKCRYKFYIFESVCSVVSIEVSFEIVCEML